MTDDQTADECGICLETLNTAVTLPCNHKFCAACLDGWKSKFGSTNKKERSKSCPLCREKIPPSKDMIIQLEYHRQVKRDFEARGETTSENYVTLVKLIKELEKEIGDYDGKGLDYDMCMELPKEIYNAVNDNNIRKVIKWLGSPVNKKRLSARYRDHFNSTLVHLAVDTDQSDLLSILLQYGADNNTLNADGFTPLMVASILVIKAGREFDQSKILLEWGAEIDDFGTAGREEVIQIMKEMGNNKVANLISSEFGGRRCEVINLPNHPHLNGKTCVVEKYIAKKEKYKIIFEGSGNAALVGPNNLKRRDRTPLDCGYYITFENGRMSRREFATKEECEEYVSSLGGDVNDTAEELASLNL